MTVDDPYALYKSEVSKVPPLERVEETCCVEHIRARDEHADAARERLLEAHLHLVVLIAERYRNDRVYILDLIIEGNKALVGALETFGESREESFSTYALPHIDHAIKEATAPASTCGLAHYPHKKIE
jgi:DNA-directed RNA polymerase sigma subunit (sigma70/sigma32)